MVATIPPHLQRQRIICIVGTLVLQSWIMDTAQCATSPLVAPRQWLGGGGRSLNSPEEAVEAKVPSQVPSSEWMFEGVLAPDGSISSAKLIMEGDQFAGLNVDKNTWLTSENETVNSRSTSSLSKARPELLDDYAYPPCSETLRDLIPCCNGSGHLYGHCPNINRASGSCAIPTPAFYARQFKWPASKNQVRGPNTPNVPILQDPRKQAWIKTRGRGNTISFLDGNPKYPDGTSKYLDDLAKMLPELSYGTNTRVGLDIGCGAGNVAAALETREVLTLSIAGEGSADNGVQLVLERGYPALVQSFVTARLPYPSQAFDLIHCAACDVRWESDGGSKLMEADRILRAGGFFIWMDPSEVAASSEVLEDLAKSICWERVATRARTFIWRKPTNATCYLLGAPSTPPLCDGPYSPDASWNVPLRSCLVGFLGTAAAITYPWPIRLDAPPGRLSQSPAAGIQTARPEAYKADLNYWMYIVAFYVADLGPIRISDIRNVLDMNAGYGGFAAAVSLNSPSLQWWVLNVVPIDQPDRLPLIFDRGLLGVYHDWCEALDVHPRTFDMVHSSGFFSSVSRCGISDIIQEVDRLLRPGGFVIIRDHEDVLLQVQVIARALHWKSTMEDTESGPRGKDKMLSCQKTFWQPRA